MLFAVARPIVYFVYLGLTEIRYKQKLNKKENTTKMGYSQIVNLKKTNEATNSLTMTNGPNTYWFSMKIVLARKYFEQINTISVQLLNGFGLFFFIFFY